MLIFINQQQHQLPEGATLTAAISVLQPAPPYAVAVNQQFVPNTRYAATVLQPNDTIDIIAPVTGG